MNRLIFALGFSVAITALVGAAFGAMFLLWWGLGRIGMSAELQVAGSCAAVFFLVFAILGYIGYDVK